MRTYEETSVLTELLAIKSALPAFLALTSTISPFEEISIASEDVDQEIPLSVVSEGR